MIVCNSCGEDFEDYHELALHISGSKKGHRKGKKWAATYLHKYLLSKRDNEFGRLPLTEEDKQNKIDTRRKLSGDTQYVNTICPKCKRDGRPLMEVEYIESNDAWRIGDKLAKTCNYCEGV